MERLLKILIVFAIIWSSLMADTVRSSPTETRPTHQIKLSDGITTLGLKLCDAQGNPIQNGQPWSMRKAGMPSTSLQIGQGDPDRSVYELPLTPMTQKDWSGGRGQRDLKDSTRFYDSYRVDTTSGRIICGPAATVAATLKRTVQAPVSDNATANTGAIGAYNTMAFASSYTPSKSFTIDTIELKLSADMLGNYLWAAIYSDNSGQPGTVLASTHPSKLTGWAVGATPGVVYWQNVGLAVTSGTPVWIAIAADASLSSSPTLYTAVNNNTPTNKLMLYNSMAGTWSEVLAGSNHQQMYFGVYEVFEGYYLPFIHKGALYVLTALDDNSAPMLFQNGLRGNASSNAADKTKLNCSLNLHGINLAGKIAAIVRGTGSAERQPWRVISSNTQNASTSNAITVSPAWNITHDTTTEFVILGMDTFEIVNPPGFATAVASPPTSVLELDDMIYVAMGEGVNMARGRLKTDGTWDTWAADGTNKATFLMTIPDDTGARKIIAAKAAAATAAVSDTKTWGTNLSFGTEKDCGSKSSRITNLLAAGSPAMITVLKEDEMGTIKLGSDNSKAVYATKPQASLLNVKDYRNGRTAFTYDVYLFFNLLKGLLERAVDDRMDDVGPQQDAGLPPLRQGEISGGCAYAGRFYISIDAGVSGYSSILVSNSIGGNWHEIYRGALGKRIRSLRVQTLPGDMIDRLWFNEGENLCYLPLTINPLQTTNFPYFSGGYVIGSWKSGAYREVVKWWKSFLVYANNLTAAPGASVTVGLQWQTDAEADSDTWHDLPVISPAVTPQKFTTSPMQRINLSTTHAISGKRWREKVTVYTEVATVTPEIEALTVDAVTRVKDKKSWTLTFVLEDATVDLQGQSQTLGAEAVLKILEDWADSDLTPCPLAMNGMIQGVDTKWIYNEQPTVQPIMVTAERGRRQEKLLCSMTVYEA